LLLNGFCEIAEQSCVFDRDHGLVGERFQQLDLTRGEGDGLGAVNH
jgi:hypothetical protein